MTGILYKDGVCVGFSTIDLGTVSAGNYNIALEFEGLHLRNIEADGPYEIKCMVVKEGQEEPELLSDVLYTTAIYSYTDFELPSIQIDSCSFTSEDANSNGLYDNLIATLTLSSPNDGEVNIEGYVTTDNLKTKVTGTGEIIGGTGQVNIVFDGKNFRDSGVDAPYNFTFIALDENYEPNHSLAQALTGYIYTDFELPKICLENTYSDQAIDTDLNGLFDELNIIVDLIITENGSYLVEAVIESENELFHISELKDLTTSDTTLTLCVEGAKIRNTGINQSYDLQHIKITDSDGNVYCERSNPYATAIYNYIDFEPDAITLTGTYTNQGVDSDENGKSNYLQINVGIEVQKPGFYIVTGHLKCGDKYLTAESGLILYEGQESVQLVFDGSDIYKTEFTGTFELERVGISDSEGNYLAYNGGVCHSFDYSYQDFDVFADGDSEPDRDVDGFDLSVFAQQVQENTTRITVEQFAGNFGM